MAPVTFSPQNRASVTDGVPLGLGETVQGFLAQRRTTGPVLKVLQQFAGKVGFAGELGATHHRRERLIEAPFGRFQFRDGVHFKLNGLGCHGANLSELWRFNKAAVVRMQAGSGMGEVSSQVGVVVVDHVNTVAIQVEKNCNAAHSRQAGSEAGRETLQFVRFRLPRQSCSE